MADLIKLTWLFPVIQSIHIIGISVMVGTIALVDFRLLGIGLRRPGIPELAARLAPWTVVGLLTILITGPLLFWSDLPRYIINPAFLVKMALLVLALASHFTLHRHVVREGALPSSRRAVAVLSLILWSCVVLAGRAIADFDIRVV